MSLKEMDNDGVQEFYTGKSIFLTGATGFLGRVIIEKLLRTCPDVRMIYLLIRTKKGKDSQQRINELFSDPVFGPMKKENSSYMEKVTLIPGDLSLPDMGISESDWKTLTKEVNVVFHGGATVRFDEKLKTAVSINISGTKYILKLCGECRNLKALVHISTAYSNCNRDEVEEVIYAPPITGDEIINLTKCLPDKMLERCTPEITHGWPNTYAFTKQIAEDLVQSEAIIKGIPTAIYRPAIVMGAHAEPIPGWIDNIYGPTGVIAAVGAGLMRTVRADGDLRAELVPIDMTVNVAFAIAWDVARKKRNGDVNIAKNTVPTYNFVTAKENPLKWKDFEKYNVKYGLETPTVKSVWYYSQTVTKHRTQYFINILLLHLLPALIVDFILYITRQKPQALKIYEKLHKFAAVLSYFSLKEWKFHNDNTIKLWTKLSGKDKKLFNFDMNIIDWDLFFKSNVKAIRIFIFQDTPDTIPAARKKMFILYILHRMIQIIFFSIIFCLIYTPMSTLFNWIISLAMSLEKEL